MTRYDHYCLVTSFWGWMQSTRARRILAQAIIGMTTMLAGLVNSGSSGDQGGRGPYRWLGYLRKVAAIEEVRITAHLGTFASTALLLGPWGPAGQRGNNRLVWSHVFLGSLLIEGVQIAMRKPAIRLSLMRSVLFDLITNAFGALAGLLVIRFSTRFE
jgi:hypothetical protein